MNPQVGAASTHVRDLLSGPARPGRVLRVGRDHAAVEVGERMLVLSRGTGPGTLPCTLAVPGLDVARLPERVVVGVGAVTLGSRAVRVVRWWEPARVRAGGFAGSWTTPSGPSVLDDATRLALHRAAAATATGDIPEAASSLGQLLGLGRGSTPDGDDAVAGLLLAARSIARTPDARRRVAQLAAHVAGAAPARTTALSAELLRAVVSGFAAPVLVEHLTAPGPTSEGAVQRLGATSGRAALEGADALHRAAPTSRREAAAA